MKYFEDILKFTDGSLEDNRAQLLFLELSSNEELRADFRKHMELEKAIIDNPGYFAPPTSSELNIMNSIGITANKPAGFFARAAEAVKSAGPISGAVVSAVVTSLIFILFFIPENGRLHSKNIQERNFARVIDDKEFAISSFIPDTIFVEKKVIHYVSNHAGRTITPITEAEPDIKPDVQADAPVSSFYMNRVDKELIEENKIIFFPDNEYNTFSRMPVGTNTIFNIDAQNSNSKNSNFELSTFVNIDGHITNTDVLPGNNTQFNNKGIAAYYKISDDLKIGLDIRRETFHQEFEDELKYYWQQPSLTTYSGVIQYHFAEFSDFSPFIRAAVGGNQAGPVFRPQLGMNYNFSDRLGLYLGAEYSLLKYHHADRNFSSDKVSFIYGINYSL